MLEYIYKVYRGATFLGLLRNVSTPFRLVRDINTAGSKIAFDVPVNMDVTDEAISPILDEDGNPILDEAGYAILPERAVEIFGNYSESALLRGGNKLEIVEVSDYYPSGKVMFSGEISRIKGRLTSEGMEEKVTVTARSNGFELVNYLVQDGS